MADYGLLAGLAEGIKSGVQSYQDTKRYNDEQQQRAKQSKMGLLTQGYEEDATTGGLKRSALYQQEMQDKLAREAAERAEKHKFDLEKTELEARLKAKAPKEVDPLTAALKQGRLDELNRKREQDIAQRNIPGLIGKQDVMIPQQDVEKLRSAKTATQNVNDKFNQLVASLEKKGPELFGDEARMQESLARDIQLDLKNPEFKQLGVLAGPDLMLLESLVQDPSSLGNWIRGGKSNIKKLRDMQSRLQGGFKNRVQSSGYDIADPELTKFAPERKGLISKEALPSQGQDPQIAQYASQYGLNYDQAKAIIERRRGNSATAKR